MQSKRLVYLALNGAFAIGCPILNDPAIWHESTFNGFMAGMLALGSFMGAVLFLNIVSGNMRDPDHDEVRSRSFVVVSLFLAGAWAGTAFAMSNDTFNAIVAVASLVALIRLIQWTMFEPQDAETAYT